MQDHNHFSKIGRDLLGQSKTRLEFLHAGMSACFERNYRIEKLDFLRSNSA
jgi:hypothetical protein